MGSTKTKFRQDLMCTSRIFEPMHVNTTTAALMDPSFHPALNSLGKVARRLHPMLTNSEEHREVFPEPPLIAFRRCKNLKDMLDRARLSNEGNRGTNKKGCSRCGKSRCQVCNVMSNSEHFHSNIDSREYRINYSFNCDSSNVVYLLECTVCGVQYVGSSKYSTASEQPGFLLFSVQTETIFKILRKIEKIKTRHSRESHHGSPAFWASALTIRLPWHVLIFSILAPYGLFSAFAFFKQRIL